ncbi:MAG: hypothetical protein IJ833_09855, partial [Lachnospiraceae bacterium]|nr:hypothetical protein [Lachnospiraceae bacterium]
MKRKNFQSIAVFTAAAILFGGMTNTISSKAADNKLPEELNLPITLIDYNADNLLFQYDLYDPVGMNFTFTSDSFVNTLSSVGVSKVNIPEHGEDIFYTTGLVEKELDTNTKLPVYKREVVEHVAKLVQAQLA